MDIFASNLKKRAEELGISNAEVARRAGLSERRYGNYVSGRREPDLATLVAIARVLETSPDNLLSYDSQTSPIGLSIPKQRIRSASNALSDEEAELIAVMVEAVSAKRRN
ncbi:helix-turn-helix transcriptional regulator [Ancylobacter sp. A5.8]|uniref:helix-turn-helix domain-containing protein n=1 Tax=Ancylobacter gelatini TaxID=2919920 RepID=UPI001F4E69A3|nr:helix-turn-helix transcriptional regulator [Ancylobacter gelatini]MCJ8145112.1 helix-turn-helix transcriptional regulator [Ancylobacter gelatini]